MASPACQAKRWCAHSKEGRAISERLPNVFRKTIMVFILQLHTLEDLSAASDELLRSCGIPGGQILRIKSGIDQFLGNNAKTTKVLIIKLIINHLI